MIDRALPAALLVACALAAPGCFATRAIGLGPDPGPNEIVKGDTAAVMYEKAQRLYAMQEWKDAANAFNECWSKYPKSDLAQDAQFYEAESRYGQQKYNGAFELYKRFLKDWPLSPHAPMIERRLYDLGTYTIQAGQHGFLGIFDYAAEGVDYLDYLVAAFPHGDLADDALIYMADYEWRNRMPKEAIDHLHDLIDNYPNSEWALEGRLRLAKAYRDINRGTRYDADSLQRSAAQYKAYIELVTADQARAREYAAQLETARAELAGVEEELARKELEAAAFYLKAGNGEAARAELANVIRTDPASLAATDARRQLGLPEPTATAGETPPQPPGEK
jgi:outer membrane assembly lipoprotein YfiO